MVNNREHWGSRWGFILAAAGSAVGLGNIWRFSYVAGENGGAAFLIIYVLCVILIGFPVMMAEFMIGRRGQSDAVGSFQKLAPGKPWFIAGGLGVAAAFIILSFYGVIAGWSLKYFFSYLTGGLWSTPPGEDGYAGYFVNFITDPVEPVIWQAIFMAITIGIVVFGVKKGIEKANNILMPALAILVVLLALYSLTLGGAREGLAFLFSPDWSAFTEPSVYLAAMGQAFFSLSLGMGAMITYSSYLEQHHKLPGSAGTIIGFDTLFAIFAGVMIFPAVFAFGGEPNAGPGLVFITLPDIFASIGGFGIIVGILFFFLLTAAALSSALSLLEVAVAYFIRKLSMNRRTTTLLIGTIIFLLGIPSSLGIGVLSGFTPLGGRDILDSLDYISGNIMLPLGGLIIALFVGWAWSKQEVFKESDLGDTPLANAFLWILRIPVPIFIAIVFIWMASQL
ncbi:sodium:neurotransmitter symporter [Caldalkalibacillus thermarum TA2.A1]|uniref:Sodium-dependent transporter n=1 Tax=Caldalkalibacillus thermarum (strain TA2.A1) TaxID=986075 RepID=F5L342_CALTT|nr:sodium-dependent transporter [Caldalkalibacillus thermarum]EGL84243.1 sodium:neurotransmitter symporter [Caldalkalibacillus thermarum TA2.A1]QZT34649.1 sodium-dependent transporter [Caldalkalibacillus thermarum TA2.A1]